MKSAAKKSRISAGAIATTTPRPTPRSLKPLSGDAICSLKPTQTARLPKPLRLARKSKTGSASIDVKPTCNALNQLISAKAESPASDSLKPMGRMRGKSIRGKKTAPLAMQQAQTNSGLREEQINADHHFNENHIGLVGAGLAFEPCPIIPIITQQWRLRQRWHKAEKTLVLQGKALCRSFTDGDKKEAGKIWDSVCKGKCNDDAFLIALSPLVDAFKSLKSRRLVLEKTLKKMARELPAYAWMKDIYGLGDLGISAIAGEAGDIRSYGNPAKLWKRFGLAVIGGERQRKKTNIVDAELHGYNPSRRSVMWNIGNGLIGCMNRGPRPLVGEDISNRRDLSKYQILFIERLREEARKNPEHRKDDREKNGALYESYSKHAFFRAKRYVEKRFLRDLWAAQRPATLEELPRDAPPGELIPVNPDAAPVTS